MKREDMQKYYEKKYGHKAVSWRSAYSAEYVGWLELRLEEEIKWGHRSCTAEDCKTSGTDCPANEEVECE